MDSGTHNFNHTKKRQIIRRNYLDVECSWLRTIDSDGVLQNFGVWLMNETYTTVPLRLFCNDLVGDGHHVRDGLCDELYAKIP